MKVLYVDDEPNNLLTFQLGFRQWFDILVTTNPFEVLEMIRDEQISVLISDQRMPGMDGLTLCGEVMKIRPELSIIILSAYDDQKVMMDAIRLGGIFRFELKPWDIVDMKQTITNAAEGTLLRRENLMMVEDLKLKNSQLNEAYQDISKLKQALEEENCMIKEDLSSLSMPVEIIGKSKAIAKAIKDATYAAKSDASVLLVGETGTGKELFAKLIHKMSSRKENLMVCINCAAIPETLMESELFGYERGAFSGALKRKHGKLEVANKGTLFLDEIGELPLNMQPKLLRALQEKEFERLGCNELVKTDFRVVAATNRNLEEAIRQGTFRSDLYYRVNIFPIVIPPLRERMEDLPLLVNHLVAQLNRRTGKHIEQIPKKTIEQLMRYHWPGNVRELANVVERAHIQSEGSKLLIGGCFQPIVEINKPGDGGIVSLVELEKRHILSILKQTNWRVRGEGGAAELLEINPSTLESKMKKWGIRRDE